MTLAHAAQMVGGRVEGDSSMSFDRLAPIHAAAPGDLALLADRRYVGHVQTCRADAFLVSEALESFVEGTGTRLVVKDALEALQALLSAMYPVKEEGRQGIHDGAYLAPDASVGEDVGIDAGAVVGSGAVLGDRVRVGANTVVGEGAWVGADSVLHPNVTIYAGVQLGERVIVHAGTRLGVDGFGYVHKDGAHAKIPQVGRCVIEDDVEIGANCTVDRGSIGETVIGAGSKIDNLVHVAHNVRIGSGSLLVAQVGIAGSTEVGPGAIFGGQAGVVGHLSIGAGARIGAQAGVIGDVREGETVSGYPARNHKDFLRAMASLMKVPDLVKRLRVLERGRESTDGSSSDP